MASSPLTLRRAHPCAFWLRANLTEHESDKPMAMFSALRRLFTLIVGRLRSTWSRNSELRPPVVEYVRVGYAQRVAHMR